MFSKMQLMGLVVQKALVLLLIGSCPSLRAAVRTPTPWDAHSPGAVAGRNAPSSPGLRRAGGVDGVLCRLGCREVGEGRPAVWLSGRFSWMELYCRAWCCYMRMLSCCGLQGLAPPWVCSKRLVGAGISSPNTYPYLCGDGRSPAPSFPGAQRPLFPVDR